MQVKLVTFGLVLGGFVLLWETQMESKKTTGDSHHMVERSSKKGQGPAENVSHLLLSQQWPSAGMATPGTTAGIWVVI